ncbi:MAG: DUF3025 domain-containing protein [Betaproteobacteria bacterium HGW-Betaproteobacteria-12]|nr:MAG: DUF3025 domain-containing protein [Betaproteobacteria bacterium HGW-Betaproteobacteria-12]
MSADALYAAPLFAPLRRWLVQLPAAPDSVALAELLARHPVVGDDGAVIRFVPPSVDGLAYECRIWTQGAVETRPDNWHDFFNALVWLNFPSSKRAVTARHMAAMAPAGAVRGQVRDALTHFDECGIVVLSTQAELLDLLRQHRWRELFVVRRQAVQACMRFVVFGHATYEQLLQPFRGLTAKAVLYEVSDDWLGMSAEALSAAVDGRLAGDFSAGRYTRPRDFQPLPLLGIPGMTPASEDPAYYDDAWQFRPARPSAP